MPRKALFTKEEIVAKALDIVRRKGTDALTARELGAALGSSSRPIFTVFKSMDEVIAEVRKAAEQMFSDYVADVGDYIPAFKEYGMRSVRFAREFPHIYYFLFLDKNAPRNSIPPKALECLNDICKEFSITQEQSITLFHLMWVESCGLSALSVQDPDSYPESLVSELFSIQFAAMINLLKSGKQVVNVTPVKREKDSK